VDGEYHISSWQVYELFWCGVLMSSVCWVVEQVFWGRVFGCGVCLEFVCVIIVL